MIIIVRYREERDEAGLIHIHSEEDSVCPVCAGALTVIGSRKRGQLIGSGDKEILVIRRLRCLKCRRIHHELPDRIIPCKRHCAETVENIINGKVKDVCCIPAIHGYARGNPRLTDNLMTDILTIGAQQSKQMIDSEVVLAAINGQALH